MKKGAAFIRPGNPEDFSAIAGVLDRVLGPRPYSQRLALWKWRYDANPARTDAFPPFLVVEEGGRIVGVHGLIPLRLKAGDAVLPISCSCDLAVEADSRSVGMKLKLAALSKELSPLHLSTSANEPACRITMALGGRELIRCRRKWILPLKAGGLMQRRLAKRGGAAGALAEAGEAIWKPLDWGLAVARSMKRPPCVKGGEIHDVTAFDERYDRFWEELAGRRAVLVVRDPAYLNWRYSAYPFPGIRSFELSRGKELLGFAAIHLAVDMDALRFAAILELAGRRDEPGSTEHLLEEAVQRAVLAGAHYITARTLVREEEGMLGKFGFLPRDLPYSPVTHKNNSSVTSDAFTNEDDWYMTLGDGDGCHYYSP